MNTIPPQLDAISQARSPRCILFDLDGTLHDRETSVRALLLALVT